MYAYKKYKMVGNSWKTPIEIFYKSTDGRKVKNSLNVLKIKMLNFIGLIQKSYSFY